MRAEDYAVESVLRVLRQQGLEIAARTYRARKRPARIAARTVTDALVEDKIRGLAWRFNEATGRIQMTPKGLYGRRKWVALLRRQVGTRLPFTSRVQSVVPSPTPIQLLASKTGYRLVAGPASWASDALWAALRRHPSISPSASPGAHRHPVVTPSTSSLPR